MNKSFTLIEILVVIVIVGVLSAFIFVGMSSISDKANIAKSQAFANSVRNSLLTSIVSEWKLDTINANQTPDAWGTNTGTLSNFNYDTTDGQRTGSDCVSGNCVLFDGSNDYISTGYAGLVSSQGTIELWVRYIEDKAQGLFHFFELATPNNDYIRSYIGPSRDLDLVIEDGDVAMLNVYFNFNHGNKWNHIVWLQDGQSVKLYINGQIKTLAGINNGSWWTSHLNMDRAIFGNAWGYIHGYMDEIRVYNKALSANAIQEDYYSGLNKLLSSSTIDYSEYRQQLAGIK
jgi:prepilin-type N-terminal cleavage/methylation domain-containing protein